MNNETREAVVFHKPEEGWSPKQEAATIDVTRKSPEHRQYLVLVWYNDQYKGEIDHTFIIAEGRSDTYFEIKDMLEIMDVQKSVVMMEGNKALVDQITVLQFLRHVLDEELIEDETAYIVEEVIYEMEGVE